MVDAVNGWISEPRLESFRIFSEVVQQPGQFAICGKAERGSKFLRQPRDIAQMLGQGLPFVLWQTVALVVFSRVREEPHVRFLTMLPPGRGIIIIPAGK
jgi:hypothetical protein